MITAVFFVLTVAFAALWLKARSESFGLVGVPFKEEGVSLEEAIRKQVTCSEQEIADWAIQARKEGRILFAHTPKLQGVFALKGDEK